MLHQVRAVLEERFEIVAALSSGEAVLSKYAALTPDVIILDISMGGMSGLDVARILRERGCRLPIVLPYGSHGLRLCKCCAGLRRLGVCGEITYEE